MQNHCFFPCSWSWFWRYVNLTLYGWVFHCIPCAFADRIVQTLRPNRIKFLPRLNMTMLLFESKILVLTTGGSKSCSSLLFNLHAHLLWALFMFIFYKSRKTLIRRISHSIWGYFKNGIVYVLVQIFATICRTWREVPSLRIYKISWAGLAIILCNVIVTRIVPWILIA